MFFLLFFSKHFHDFFLIYKEFFHYFFCTFSSFPLLYTWLFHPFFLSMAWLLFLHICIYYFFTNLYSFFSTCFDFFFLFSKIFSLPICLTYLFLFHPQTHLISVIVIMHIYNFFLLIIIR